MMGMHFEFFDLEYSELSTVKFIKFINNSAMYWTFTLQNLCATKIPQIKAEEGEPPTFLNAAICQALRREVIWVIWWYAAACNYLNCVKQMR